MADLERNYTIPLRKDFIKVPKYRRAKRAVSEIKQFISKHMKTEDVKIGKHLNEHLWNNGIKNPPGKVKIRAVKDGEIVKVELEGFEYKVEGIQKEKTEKATSLKDKLAATIGGAKKESKEKPKELPKEKSVEDKLNAKPVVEKKETALQKKPEVKKE